MGMFMGGEKFTGKKSGKIANLLNVIGTQGKLFRKQSGKAKLWDKLGDFIQKAAIMTRDPKFIALGHGADFLIDYFSSKSLMSKVDPEAITSEENVYTGTGYGEKFGEKVDEATPTLMSSLLDEGLDVLTTLTTGDTMRVPEAKTSPVDLGSEGLEFFQHLISGDQEQYYGGDSVQRNGTPTIAEYFNNQGLSLGGSNKQSVAEILNRR